MNKIRNSLGCPGSLNVKDIICDKSKKKWKVSVLSGVLDDRGSKIWDQYFHLLFSRYNLPDKLLKHKEELKTQARPLHDYLFPTFKSLDEKKLLELLLFNPQSKVDPFDYRKIKNTKPITDIFNYEYITSYYKREFATLVFFLDVKVCPYCGRTFATTAQKSSGGFIRTCQVDHFLPKSIYPWFALSIWNFIPVCGFCNNHKSDNIYDILYPYTEEMGDLYRFKTHPVNGIGYLVGTHDSEEDFEISLDSAVHLLPESAKPTHPGDPTVSFEYDNRVNNEINLFGINELYSSHKSYVCYIFRQRFIFGTPYIDSLASELKNVFHSKDDVRAMMYLKRIDSESIGSSVLDKLTRDINHEIDLLE